MKPRIICVIILLLLIVIGIPICYYSIKSSVTVIIDYLEQCEQAVQAGDMELAGNQFSKAADVWERSATKLGAIVIHSELDEIQEIFKRTEWYLKLKMLNEYETESQLLKLRLNHLLEMESLSIKNIF